MIEILSAVELAMKPKPGVWEKNVIPPMTDPMGKHWKQPDMSQVLIDDTYALMTESTLAKLPEYTHSLPTGIYPGKCWKKNRLKKIADYQFEYTDNWCLFWFGYDQKNDPHMCSINYRNILIV